MCVWVNDADKLEYDSKELGVVYENNIIQNFLNSSSSLGLAGVKGQGKTFLLKVKRKNCVEQKEMVCLPYGRMVDTVDSSLEIDDSMHKFLSDYNSWVNLWKFSIAAAIITCKELQNTYRIRDVSGITATLLQDSNGKGEASYFLKQLLNMNIDDVISILKDTWKLLETLKDTQSGICIFLDKLDQGFSKYVKDFDAYSVAPRKSRQKFYWKYAQYALAECAYDIYSNISRHIKVIFSIRQEALIDVEDLNKDKARNINSYITTLDYNYKDLQSMYNLYICNEKKENLAKETVKETKPSEAFVGIEEMQHGYIESEIENVFDYIYRHTFKRPYDIMKICRKLFFSRKNNILSQKEIRHIVNRESNELLSQYLKELSVFLPCKIEEIYELMKIMTGNISNASILHLCCEIHCSENVSDDAWHCNKSCINCHDSKIFSVLYNIGLVGADKKNEADKNPIIQFENIGVRILDLHSYILPHSKYYYLHPALSNLARDKRKDMGLPYNMSKSIIVGDQYEILNEKYKKIVYEVRKNNNQLKKEKVFVSSTVYDMEKERDAIRDVIKKRGLHPIMSEENFDIVKAQNVHSHDHCLNEITKCKSLVFVIGEEYGGEYAGEKYKKEYQEITDKSKYRIEKPSISLMEFYLARKNKLKCYVFVSKKVQEKHKDESLNKDVRNLFNFINHFTEEDGTVKGNWMITYSDINNLKTEIYRLKFI